MSYCNCDYTPPESRPCMNCRYRAAYTPKQQPERADVSTTAAWRERDGLSALCPTCGNADCFDGLVARCCGVTMTCEGTCRCDAADD